MILEDRIHKLKREARRQELVVLVWGPGDPGPAGDPQVQRYWRKRNEIRDQIKQAFPHAEVLFSEDSSARAASAGLSSPLDEELAQAAVADCILVLDVTRGAHVEVDRYTIVPSIAAKMTVLLPAKFVGGTGLVSFVHQKTNVSGFTDDEFDSCRVAREKAIQIVETTAITKLLNDSRFN